MLGWITTTVTGSVDRDFFVRQLRVGEDWAIIETMNPRAMTAYARLWGHALTRAPARSGDPMAIASYLGGGDSFDRAPASFAETYADQNERDHDALRDAVTSARVTADTSS
jgi:hypothetical protein